MVTVYEYDLVLEEAPELELETEDDAAPELGIDSQIVMAGGPEYEGDYTVTPRLEAMVLPTQGYLMRDDVTVLEIPVSRVHNPQDGLTVIIG